ncbi:hypothetical protein [Halobaculum marinum]|uniref:Uncharacterized protein n=1 Tax=Halobaculum marinum TaxID=3031996 RepID=A0ABD5WVU6_9EURY|nr:hypothetical protein [Halobaculum sp. DT55]
MATLNAYSNDPGYYIRAWTSDLRNFNYKIRSEGWDIIDSDPNLTDGVQISWKYINTLKALGVVYTEESGVISPDDEKFTPDPDQTSESLSREEAMEFLDAIRSTRNLSTQELEQISSVLGIETLDDNHEELESNISSQIKEELSNNRKLSGEVCDSVVAFTPEWKTESDDLYHRLFIILVVKDNSGSVVTSTTHTVKFHDGTLADWSVIIESGCWKARGEAYQHVGSLLPIVVNNIEERFPTMTDTWLDPEINLTVEG